MTERFTERPQPYIGISGVVAGQQLSIYDSFRFADYDNMPNNTSMERRIALGVKATHKTQFLDVANKYGPEWYPVGEEFSNALEKNYGGLRVAQIYLDQDYVADADYRKAFVDKICRRGKAWLNALQFDMLPWQNDESMLVFLHEVKEETGHAILLQAHSEAMQQLGPEGVARKLGHYAHALDYILFDASHGKGVRMNPDALKPYLNAGYSSDKLSKVGFSVAGGLNAKVVREDLPGLVEHYPDLSWDAEGQLHSTLEDGTRPLDRSLTAQYVYASSDILRMYN